MEDDVQNTKEFKNLTEVVDSFQKPSLTIKTPIYNEYKTFTYNEEHDSFVMGFESGEVNKNFKIKSRLVLVKFQIVEVN